MPLYPGEIPFTYFPVASIADVAAAQDALARNDVASLLHNPKTFIAAYLFELARLQAGGAPPRRRRDLVQCEKVANGSLRVTAREHILNSIAEWLETLRQILADAFDERRHVTLRLYKWVMNVKVAGHDHELKWSHIPGKELFKNWYREFVEPILEVLLRQYGLQRVAVEPRKRGSGDALYSGEVWYLQWHSTARVCFPIPAAKLAPRPDVVKMDMRDGFTRQDWTQDTLLVTEPDAKTEAITTIRVRAIRVSAAVLALYGGSKLPAPQALSAQQNEYRCIILPCSGAVLQCYAHYLYDG